MSGSQKYVDTQTLYPDVTFEHLNSKPCALICWLQGFVPIQPQQHKQKRPFSQKTFWLFTVGKAQVWIMKLMMAEFHFAVSVSGSRYCACRLTVTLSWLTGTFEYNRDIVNAISNTCAFPTMTSVCSEKKPISEVGFWFWVIRPG